MMCSQFARQADAIIGMGAPLGVEALELDERLVGVGGGVDRAAARRRRVLRSR